MTWKVTLTVQNLSDSYTLGNVAHINCSVFTHKSDSVLACNFNCHVKTEGLLKVIGSHVHGGNGNSLEMVQERHCCYRPLIGVINGLSNHAISDDLD